MKDYTSLRQTLHQVIFESDTRAGRTFDIVLFVVICGSVVAIMLESVAGIRERYGDLLHAVEWAFTITFTVEYVLRLACVGRPRDYALSFYGIVDLLAVLPTYVSVLVPGAQFLLVVRLLRLLRIFRVLKLLTYVAEAAVLRRALSASRRKIGIFLLTVLILVVILGSMMYFVEGGRNGFDSIPRSVYWAIVTLTTVGYGDISPQTATGQVLASIVMIVGYGIIAVPTGIVTTELARVGRPVSGQTCRQCSAEGHDTDARHCKYCGAAL